MKKGLSFRMLNEKSPKKMRLMQAFEVSSLVEKKKKKVSNPYKKKMVMKNWLQEIDLEEFLFEFVTLGVEEPSDFPLVCPHETYALV